MSSGRVSIDLLAILKKNLNRTTFVYILKYFRMCTIEIEALTPLDRTSRIKMYKNQAKETAAGAVCDVICDLVSIDVATEQL